MLDAGKASSRWAKAMALIALAVGCLITPVAGKDPTIEELKARIPSAPIGDRPHLCLQVAQQQLASTDKLYAAEENEKARASLADVVAFSELARDYSIQSHKHQKQTELSLRTMVRELGDLKHTDPPDQQPMVHTATD